MKSSSLDRIFQAAFAIHSFKARNLQNKIVCSTARQQKSRARKNEICHAMFGPFRTMGHSRFGWGSHWKWGLIRVKNMICKQQTVLGQNTFHKNAHKSTSRPSPGMIPVAK